MSLTSNFFIHTDASLLKFEGNDVFDLFNRLSTNNIETNQDDAITTTIFTNENGRCIDVVSVWSMKNNTALVESSSSNKEILVSWIEKYIIEEDVKIFNRDDSAVLSIFNTTRTLNINIPEFDDILENKPVHMQISGVNVLASKHSFFNGHECIKIIFPNNLESCQILKFFLMERKIEELDDDQFESFRIANLIPRSGKEITTEFNPLELNLYDYIDFNKGCCIGQEVIARLDTYDKVQRVMKLLHSRKDSSIVENKGCTITSNKDPYLIGVVRKKILS